MGMKTRVEGHLLVLYKSCQEAMYRKVLSLFRQAKEGVQNMNVLDRATTDAFTISRCIFIN
jgi:hypothetical protein